MKICAIISCENNISRIKHYLLMSIYLNEVMMRLDLVMVEMKMMISGDVRLKADGRVYIWKEREVSLVSCCRNTSKSFV